MLSGKRLLKPNSIYVHELQKEEQVQKLPTQSCMKGVVIRVIKRNSRTIKYYTKMPRRPPNPMTRYRPCETLLHNKLNFFVTTRVFNDTSAVLKLFWRVVVFFFMENCPAARQGGVSGRRKSLLKNTLTDNDIHTDNDVIVS